MIKYRQATNEDFELAFRIKNRSIRPYIEKIWGWDNYIQLEYHIDDFVPASIQVILDDKENVLGLINTSEDENIFYIKSILIDGSAQGRGVGTKVITDIIGRSRLSNKKVELSVFKINDRARSLYERLGFKITGETDLHYQMTCI